MKLGYLGPKGTYCQEAAEKYMRSFGDYSFYEYKTINDTLFAVIDGEIEYAVVPIENSIEGSVNTTLDVLAEYEQLRINAEMFIEVKHSLMAKPGTKASEIVQILSHPQGLAQCAKYLHKKYHGVQTRVTSSTADAAREAMESDKKYAAICNVKAAELYGLEVLDKDIQDSVNNVTRFVVVSLKDSEKTGNDKTSIVFSAEDKPGSLYRILDIFNLWDVNLTKIESRPAKNQIGKYIFFVDFVGHKMEQDIMDALTMVERKTSFLKILGSYHRID